MKNKLWILIIIVVVVVIFVINKVYITNYYDKVRPEDISFYGENGEIVANIGTYSWSKKVLGKTLFVNACGIGPLEMNYKYTLKIVRGENIKTNLMYNIIKITIYKYYNDEAKIIENPLEYDEINQKLNTSKMDIGTYIIGLHVKEGNNDAWYSFKLEILDSEEYSSVAIKKELNSHTFYAKIKRINGTSLLVDGLDVNDINYRGEFSFKISEKTKIEWKNTIIDIYDLDEGDNISITFKGDIQEIYPVQISNIVRIQLLDD